MHLVIFLRRISIVDKSAMRKVLYNTVGIRETTKPSHLSIPIKRYGFCFKAPDVAPRKSTNENKGSLLVRGADVCISQYGDALSTLAVADRYLNGATSTV